MANPPTDISAILAALGKTTQRSLRQLLLIQAAGNNQQAGTNAAGGTPVPPPGQPPIPPHYAYPTSATPTNAQHMQGGRPQIPTPTSATAPVDLSSIKPVSTGSVSLADAIAKAREKGEWLLSSYPFDVCVAAPNHHNCAHAMKAPSPVLDLFQETAPVRPPQTPLLIQSAFLTVPESSPPPPFLMQAEFPPAHPLLTPFLEQSGFLTVSASSGDPRTASRGYRRSRSRSRSPPRRESFRNDNPYRDERRDQRRGGGRDRSASPQRRGAFSPTGRIDRRSPVGRQDDGGSEVITVASSDVGLIIGRGGENLRRVEKETGARVQFLSGPENSGPQRQCRISGSARQRADAKADIYRVTEDDPNSGALGNVPRMPLQQQALPSMAMPQGGGGGGGDRNSLQIMVPDKTVGLIIGRGGETIRDLQDRSGCHVNITAENNSINGMRPVNLIGSRESQARAQDLINEVVSSDTRAGEQMGGNQPPRFDPYSNMPPSSYGNSNEKINDKMHVPSEAVGMIIGKGGETIKDMQNQSGCKINVSQPSGQDITREIGLIGTRPALEHAKTLINEKVNAVREKQGGRMRADTQDSYIDYSRQQQQGQPAYSYDQSSAQSQAQGVPASGAGGQAADPYAPYGGYQAYMAMWYAAAQQQQQQQQPGAGQSGPPPS